MDSAIILDLSDAEAERRADRFAAAAWNETTMFSEIDYTPSMFPGSSAEARRRALRDEGMEIIDRVEGDDRALTWIERERVESILRQLDGAPLLPRAAAFRAHLGCGGVVMANGAGHPVCRRCFQIVFGL